MREKLTTGEFLSDIQVQILRQMCELTNCPSLDEFGSTVGLNAKQVEQQMKELSRAGYINEDRKGYAVTNKGKNAVKLSIENCNGYMPPPQPANGAWNPQPNETNPNSTSYTTTKSPENVAQSTIKEIIRETKVIVKIRCQYCRNTYEEIRDKCPYCGAKN
jgi:predicted transcriptional regulator